MKQYAFFGEASYKILDDLKLTAGMRYFRYTIQNHADQAGLGTASANQDHTILDTSQSGSATLPKLNLSYTPTPDLTIYGTVAKGSRPGGVNLPIPIPSIQQLEANSGAYNCNLPLANQLDPTLPSRPARTSPNSPPTDRIQSGATSWVRRRVSTTGASPSMPTSTTSSGRTSSRLCR
jgi:hypothetical protein